MANVTEVSTLQPRRGGGSATIAGGVVSWATRTGLARWSLADRHDLPTVATRPRMMAVAGHDGSAWLVTNDQAAAAPELDQIGPAGTLAAVAPQPKLAAATDFVAVTAREIFAADRSGLDVFGRASGERTHREAFKADEAATCAALDDGVVFYQAGAVVRIGPGATRATYTVAGSPLHYAAGGDRDHLWASHEGAVELLKLAAGAATVERTVAVPGVYRLASVDGDAAVLSVAMKAGAWDKLTVTVVGTDGAIRWTKVLPAPAREFAEIAGGSGHVAVILDGVLHLLTAADGAAVTP
ncbi:MAG: hypothetical protein JNK64_06865 [Myxococcales bacterium]|nr:hypothetical protein [Myxococcales bacterium]